jgi:hypothetical protein
LGGRERWVSGSSYSRSVIGEGTSVIGEEDEERRSVGCGDGEGLM